MGLSHRALELDPLAVDAEEHAAFLIVHGAAQFVFERGHLRQELGDSFVHGILDVDTQPAAP